MEYFDIVNEDGETTGTAEGDIRFSCRNAAERRILIRGFTTPLRQGTSLQATNRKPPLCGS